jgi:hypothetical protein
VILVRECKEDESLKWHSLSYCQGIGHPWWAGLTAVTGKLTLTGFRPAWRLCRSDSKDMCCRWENILAEGLVGWSSGVRTKSAPVAWVERVGDLEKGSFWAKSS